MQALNKPHDDANELNAAVNDTIDAQPLDKLVDEFLLRAGQQEASKKRGECFSQYFPCYTTQQKNPNSRKTILQAFFGGILRKTQV